MLIDTHAHLNFKDFENDWHKVIERSLVNNVWMINVGSNYQTSKRAKEITEKYEKGIYPHTKRGQPARGGKIGEASPRYGVGVYVAIGLHPIHAQDGFDKEKFKSLALGEKVVAIGEIGLDYYRDYANFKEKQKQVFLEQISLTQELNLPLIFHCRKAHQDLLEVLKSQIPSTKLQTNSKSQILNSKLSGVVHCFTGSWKQAKEYLDMGFYLGFNGIIYKLNLKEVIEKTPLDRILIETDCPFLTPPEAGPDRNEPVFVRYIARDIARIKNISYQEIIETTTKNAKELFKI